MWNPQFGYPPSPWQGIQYGQGHPPASVPQPFMGVAYQHTSHATVPQMSGVYHQPRPPNPNMGWGQPAMNPINVLPQQHPTNFTPNFPRQPYPPGLDEVDVRAHGIPGQPPAAMMHMPAQNMGFGDGGVMHHPQMANLIPGQLPNAHPIANTGSFPPVVPGHLPNAPPLPPGNLPPFPVHLPSRPQLPNDMPSGNGPPVHGQVSSGYVAPIPNQVTVTPISNHTCMPTNNSFTQIPAIAPPLPSQMPFVPPPPPLPGQMPNDPLSASSIPGQVPIVPPAPMHINVQSVPSRSEESQISSWRNNTNTQSLYGQQYPVSSRSHTMKHTSNEHHSSISHSVQSSELRNTSSKAKLGYSPSKSNQETTTIASPGTEENSPLKSKRRDLTSMEMKSNDSSKLSPNKKHHANHSTKLDHKSRSRRQEQVSPRKRESHQSPSSSQLKKKPRHDNDPKRDEQRNKTDNTVKLKSDGRRTESGSQSDCSTRSTRSSRSDVRNSQRGKRTPLDHTRSGSSIIRSNSTINNRQKKDQQEAGSGCSKANKASENKRPDLPLRCVSPPPPDVNRVIKFLVPDEYYKLSKHPRTLRTLSNATKKLEELYETFENKVLAPSAEENQDLSPEISQSSDKIPKAINEENGFEIESLDDSDFETEEHKPRGEYSADTFAANDEYSDESDEDENDGDVSDSSSEEEDQNNEEMTAREVRHRKLTDPTRLHPDLWFNEKGEGNDGPVCKCCSKAKQHGIRHAIYPEEKDIPLCNQLCNNSYKLYHYWVTVTPHSNFMTERPTRIRHKGKDFVFEGFSIISHQSLDKIPSTSFIRFNIEYSIHLVKEPLPKNFCIKGLDLFSKFVFSNILELLDWTLKGQDKKGCPLFHFLPRFIHRQQDQQDGKDIHELLSMDKVLSHLIKNSSEDLIKPYHITMPSHKLKAFGKSHYNIIVRQPHKKPAAFRIDDVLFNNDNGKREYPLVLHHGIRPVQMSYSGNPKYQKLWKTYTRLRNTLANKPVASRKDHDRLVQMKIELERMRLKSSMRREVQVRISSKGLMKTGINSDICQHAMVLPVLVHHLRYHMCLKSLDNKLGYAFKDHTLLQLALTHPSYHLNFGTNPDQARNTLTNCGVKQPRYGDRRIHRMNTKQKGITHLIRIMANLGKIEENQSIFKDNFGNVTKFNNNGSYRIRHNERLEFLGDAVLEFICSSHLFYMLPDNNEGHLAIYRSGLVQNTHLAALAKSFNLSDYMQYSHGPDLCKEEDLNHAMANCFEAIIGAVFLESGLKAATDLFTKMAFKEEVLKNVWVNTAHHPLQKQQPGGDRHLIPSSPVLQKLQELEESVGITFTHIRLLARAFTHPQVGFNNLTLGDNQRMEFLGDSVLQLIISIYLYQHFPEHHEGHLTLLRSSLVNNRTQADVARQLGLEKYINFGPKEVKNVREKLLADVLEAFVAAIYIDKGLKHVEMFCRACFFPRVEDNIVNQEWIDPKSQLQQCCLALREGGKLPDLPVYKVLQDAGPSHHKRFQVGVYYKGKRCGTGEGQSMHQAEMTAAKDALESSYFPELSRQKHLLDNKYQEKRTRRYEPPKPREKRAPEKTVQEPSWVEQE